MEEEELKLITEENQLQEELHSIQEKHKDVMLVYEKVVENIKHLSKADSKSKKQEEIINNTINMNNSSDGTVNEFETSQLASKISGPSEEELAKNFFDYLGKTKAIIQRLYMNVGKKEFENMLRDRGNKSEETARKPLSQREKNKEYHSKKHASEGKSSANTASQTLITNYEYDYSDEELKEDDKRVKDEYATMAHQFKKIVIIINQLIFLFIFIYINLGNKSNFDFF